MNDEHPYKAGDRVLIKYCGKLVRGVVTACFYGEIGVRGSRLRSHKGPRAGFHVNVRPDTWADHGVPLTRVTRDAREVQPVDVVSELAVLGRFLPTEEDIGRAVIYEPTHGSSEDGVITGVNDSFVFVRYRKQHPASNGQATSYENLRWLTP